MDAVAKAAGAKITLAQVALASFVLLLDAVRLDAYPQDVARPPQPNGNPLGRERGRPLQPAPVEALLPLLIPGVQARAEKYQQITLETRALWDPVMLAAVEVSPRITAIVHELDSPDFLVRSKASAALITDETPMREMFAVLAREKLSAEQRERLFGAIRSQLLDSPRGALGVRMGQDLGSRSGVRIESLLPGMPAAAVLRPGDRIESIDGHPTLERADVVTTVQMKKPGTTAHLVVHRPERDDRGRERRGADGQIIEARVEVDIKLGAVSELDRFGQPSLRLPTDELQTAQMDALREAEAMFCPQRRLLLPADEQAEAP